MRRLALFGGACAAVAGAACYAIEQPQGGIASISTIVAPWPSVVAGDVMRDSAGRPAPLHVYAFGVHGDTLPNTPTFVLVDTGAYAHLNGNLLMGDMARSAPVHVVGAIGNLETPPLSIFVTTAPTTLRVSAGLTGRLADTLHAAPDTAWTANNSTVQFRVTGGVRDTAGVAGWLIYPRIVFAPASSDTAPTAYVLGNGSQVTTQDTTDASGNVSVRVLLRAGAIRDTSLLIGCRSDSIKVRVRALYKGQPLTGGDTTYIIPIQFTKIASSC